MSIEQAILDRFEQRSAQIAQLQSTVHALERAADSQREHAMMERGRLLEENKKLAAQIEASQWNREHLEKEIIALRTKLDVSDPEVLTRSEQLIKSLNDEITKRDHELRAHEKELAEAREEIRAIIETATYFGMTSDEGVGNFIKRKCIESEDVRDEITSAETNLELARRECEQIRREVPLESTREALKNAVAKLQEVTTDRDRVLNKLGEILAEANKSGRCGGDPVALLKQGQLDLDMRIDASRKYAELLEKVTEMGEYSLALGRKEGEGIEMFMERQALRLAALEAAITAAKCDELAKATARIKPLEALYKTLKGWQENDHIIGYGLTIDTAINKATEALSQLTA